MGSFDRGRHAGRSGVYASDKVGVRAGLARQATEIAPGLCVTSYGGLPLRRFTQGDGPALSSLRFAVASSGRLPQSRPGGARRATILCGPGDVGVDGWAKPSHGSVC